MRTLAKLTAPAAILGAAWLFNASLGLAKPEYTRKTKKECEFCHPPNNRELNEAGKYYRDHNYSLEGYHPKGSQGKNDQANNK
jgi:hypothetical protein